MINEVGKTYGRPWGSYKTLEMVEGDNGFQVKTITVNPGGIASLQKHFKRQEHWIVVDGTMTVTIDDEVKDLNTGERVYIPLGTIHRLENRTDVPATLVEVQLGSYLGEDDIERIEDNYGREGSTEC